jgi:hypothetical protein
MTLPTVRRPSPPAQRVGPGLIGAVLAVIAVLTLSTPFAAASPRAAWGAHPIAWTNGAVLCEFAPTAPNVAVSALGRNDSGMSVAVASVAEMRPNGSIAASTSLAGLTWSVTNVSSEDDYELAFAMDAPLWSGSTQVGTADIALNYSLPAYQSLPGDASNLVTIQGSIANWTWQAAGDSLVLSLSISPAESSQEHLAFDDVPGWLMASDSNATGQSNEAMGLEPTANTTSPTGTVGSIAVESSMRLASATNASVALTFPTGVAGAESIQFGGYIGVTLPATIAGIPVAELVEVTGAGAAVSLVLAGLVYRIRHAPSDLVYVEEEP